MTAGGKNYEENEKKHGCIIDRIFGDCLHRRVFCLQGQRNVLQQFFGDRAGRNAFAQRNEFYVDVWRNVGAYSHVYNAGRRNDDLEHVRR